MTDKLAIWEQPKFEGTSLIPTAESVALTANPQGVVGRENVDVEDLIVPTLSLLQGQSDAVTSALPGAVPGLFQHSNSGEIIQPPLKCVVVHYHKSNAFFPQADKYPEAKDLEKCLSRDAMVGTQYGSCEECRKCLDWMDDGRPPMGARNHMFTVLTDTGPAMLRFSRTSYKAGKRFLSNWNFSTKNLWDHPVLISVKAEPKQLPGGKSTVYQTLTMHWLTDEVTPNDWRAACLRMFNQISGAHEAGKLGDELEGSQNDPEVGSFD